MRERESEEAVIREKHVRRGVGSKRKELKAGEKKGANLEVKNEGAVKENRNRERCGEGMRWQC